LDIVHSEPWSQLCQKLVHAANVLGGANFSNELQSNIADLSCKLEYPDVLTWLTNALPSASLSSLDDYHWLVSADVIDGKSLIDQCHLSILNEGDDSVQSFIRRVPVLLRLLLWKRTADIMPGTSDLWQQELSRELASRRVGEPNGEASFLSVADVQQFFQFDPRSVQHSACPSGFDLPRAHGGDKRSVSRNIVLHSVTGSVMSFSVSCPSPFARAWCRFVFRSCHMYVKTEWSTVGLPDSFIPKGRLLLSDSAQGYTLEQIYIMLQLVPDN